MALDPMPRFSSLDGFRGLFALAVALFHLGLASHLYANPILREAYLCVDFFFVLSGFVITHAYAGRLGTVDATIEFVIRRFGRLWPLHIAVLAAFVAVELIKMVFLRDAGAGHHAAFQGSTSPDALVANVFLLHSLYLYETFTWNVPSWSISAEFVAYLVFAAVSFTTRKWSGLAALAVIGICIAMICAWSTTGMNLTAHLGAVRACLGFFAGNLAYLCFQRFRLPQFPGLAASAVELAVALLVVAYLSVVQGSWLGYFAPALFAAAIYVFAGSDGIVSWLMRSGPLQFLGKISYSVYMVHYLVTLGLDALSKLLERQTHQTLIFPAALLYGDQTPRGMAAVPLSFWGSFWAMDGVTLAYVVVVLLLATLTYKFVEQPGRRYFAGLAKSRAGAPSRLHPI